MLEISLDEDCERKQERKKRTAQWNYTGKHTEKEGSGKYQKNLGRKKNKNKRGKTYKLQGAYGVKQPQMDSSAEDSSWLFMISSTCSAKVFVSHAENPFK